MLEGLATYWSFIEGVIITAILASIFIDFVLAITSHLFQQDICKMKNELIWADDKRVGAISNKLKSAKQKQHFFYLLILISALFKIFWFYNVYTIIDATTLFIMTCYIIGAILHITCTGYAIFTFLFNTKINREHKKYQNTMRKEFAFDEREPLRSDALNSADLNPAEVGRHRLVKANDGKFYLETFGVLTDSDLRSLIGRQTNPEQRRSLAIDGVKHQMLILQQDPKIGQTANHLTITSQQKAG